MKRIWQLMVVVAVVVVGLGASLAAQEQVGEFRPVSAAELEAEQIPAANLVFAAYAFVWVAFVVYLFMLWQRMKRVEADLADVRSKLGGARR